MTCGTMRESVMRTCGPSSMPFLPCVGLAPRASGTSTATIDLPSPVHSKPVISVESKGVFVNCTDFPVVASATYRCDAFSKFAMYATCVPAGDQPGAEIDAPFGV